MKRSGFVMVRLALVLMVWMSRKRMWLACVARGTCTGFGAASFMYCCGCGSVLFAKGRPRSRRK